MTIPCMRILVRTGSSCSALYPRLRIPLRGNGVRTGVYNNWASRVTARRSVVTMLHRRAKPDDEDDDFIPHLRDSIIEALQKPGITANRYIILQATPSYAHLVSDPIFLRESIDRAVKTAGFRIHRVEAVGVVVDSIPKSMLSPYSEGWSLMITDRLMRFYGDTSPAFRNFEFRPAPVADMPSSPQPNFSTYRASSRNPDDDRGDFQIIFRSMDMTDSPKDLKQRMLARNKELIYVRTKMANTLFQNGSPSTAMVHKYRVDANYDGSNATLRPELVNRIKDVTVRLSESQVWETRVNFPVRSITEPRKIVNGVGNVIKKLAGPDGKEINASQELEAAVADLSVKKGLYDPVTLEKKPIEIFARISFDDSKALGQRLPPRYGGRFAKVLAGGGGWGVNAGILALDPEVIQYFAGPGKSKTSGGRATTPVQGRWIAFYYNDPMKSTSRSRKDSSLGQWKFTMVGKGDIFGSGTGYSATDPPSVPTALEPVGGPAVDPKEVLPQGPTEAESQQDPKDATPQESMGGTSQQDSKDTAASQGSTEEVSPQSSQEMPPPLEGTKPSKKFNYPAQQLQTGADTALWINGQKMEIPMFSLKMDLLVEIGEATAGIAKKTLIRFIGNNSEPRPRGFPLVAQKEWKKIGESKGQRPKKRKRPPQGLSLSARRFIPLEGKKYEAEIQKARSNDNNPAIIEGDNQGLYGQPKFSEYLARLKKREAQRGLSSDGARVLYELEKLQGQQEQLAEVKAGIGAAPKEFNKEGVHESAQRDASERTD
ncbi:hypothetical protein TWF191_003192 [Orbilia oligospora]|uniref:Uncharacterized protein n=1 Tax=Orbilia oligospora TaxID=2813651 RepID=A0A7C8Q8D6_ORBOL|nr:hypothetical protein TWF191_003192 [Orbilia oligospora]KAF3223845.1 hypothetical protein TWF679_000279 [Orbilia oligospora]